MVSENHKRIETRVIVAAEAALNDHSYVSAIDVLTGMGWLNPVHVSEWRRGQIGYLERVIQPNLSKISYAMKMFRAWATKKGLKPSETVYLVRTAGPKRHARFSKSGNEAIEKAYRTHFVSPDLGEKKIEVLKKKLSKSPEIVAFCVLRDSRCVKCKTDLTSGSFLVMEAGEPLCLKCAGLGRLVYLPSGDAKITRQARQLSSKSAVVVQFRRSRKRYERQGLLVEEGALEKVCGPQKEFLHEMVLTET